MRECKMKNKENEGVNVRVTRARARAMKASSTNQNQNQNQNVVGVGLTDVTNSSHLKRFQTSNFQEKEGCKKRKTKVASDRVPLQVLTTQEDVKTELAKEDSSKKEMKVSLQPSVEMESLLLLTQDSVSSPNKDVNMICEKLRASAGLGIVDIDSELREKDPLIWSSYAPDIYNTIHVRECERRPLANYMEKLQQDINPKMRAILVDWLVEVSEEYKLVPDTLYLTVNLIDRVLSQRLITKQRLQLLGVACMLTSSKYEEITAPQIKEFCFITDYTYSKEEILKMEREVLNLLNFQLAVPTIKTFLRRFIQVAQTSYKVVYAELEFLANYLAELSLVEYSFLQFLPSKIAASAVLLARWTLHQSEHPWNPTLEHYTNYKASELKNTVLALLDLQLNTEGCCLNAVREKYKQQKFKSVANLSAKPVESLF
ncbi:cyclin-A2-2 [Cicer arietinum]|uniref:B-like cyclin n=1 Tax=Cicer arietinum TaxID=3827 RepID=A0A1S2Y4J4_CICAR|nr:cyclin-A2-2 [Cicer arietinum]